MNAKCIVPVEVERTIACFWCNHCVHKTKKVQKGLWEWVKGWGMDFSREKEIYLGYHCKLLEKPIQNPESEELEDAPCKFEKWEQTNNGYELEDEVYEFILKFRNGELQSEVTK